MMRSLSIIFSLFAFTLSASNPDLIALRSWYYKAAQNKTDAEVFHILTKSELKVDPNTVRGYNGISYMIKANHALNPYSKLSFFLKGKDILDRSIEADPKNVELRFLRFCVQTQAPDFLRYSSKINEDKTYVLLGFINGTDKDLAQRIKSVLSESKFTTEKEMQIIKSKRFDP